MRDPKVRFRILAGRYCIARVFGTSARDALRWWGRDAGKIPLSVSFLERMGIRAERESFEQTEMFSASSVDSSPSNQTRLLVENGPKKPEKIEKTGSCGGKEDP